MVVDADEIQMELMAQEVRAGAVAETPAEEAPIEVGEEIFEQDPDSLDANIERLSVIFRALGHSTRLELVAYLSDSALSTVTNMAVLADIPISTLTHHLRVLEQAGVVEVSRAGRERRYELSATCKALLAQFMLAR